MEGESLVPILTGKKKSVKKYAVSQFRRGKAMGYAFRTDRYRYVVWMGENFRTTQAYQKDLVVAEELYDYQKDKFETRNMLYDSGYGNILEEMQALSQQFFLKQIK